MFEIIMQLHGGGPKATTIKQSAPGSQAAAAIDNATADQRLNYQRLLRSAKGRRYTNQAGGEIEKALKLGE